MDRSCADSDVTAEFAAVEGEGDGSLAGAHGVTFAGDHERDALALAGYPVLSWHGFHFVVDPSLAGSYAAELAGIDDAFAARGIGGWLDLDGWDLLATSDDEYEGD